MSTNCILKVASMALVRSVLPVLFVCVVLFSTCNSGVEGGDNRLLTKGENNEFEKQLKLLNKPSAKSIQTKYGDIYDCIDFYKQPTFDHPLLKNHTFHPRMKPFSVPKLMRDDVKLSKASSNIWLKGLGCPSGTVPIRRVTKDDLIREKLHLQRYNSKYSALSIDNPGTHYAMVQTTTDSTKTYNGGGADIAIFNPPVNGSQYSSGRIKIRNGLESIQAGWTVNPTLYGDNRSRLYIYSNTGQSRCFNTRCPGFIIVDTQTPLDVVLGASEKGGQTVSMKFFIYRDYPVGNWWLVVGKSHRKVGFWPQRIFTSLAGLATSVEWGGEVFSPPDIPSPQMGSGSFPIIDLAYDAFCYNTTIINEAHEIVNPVNNEEYLDVDCYEVRNMGIMKIGALDYGHVICFGGPGGATGN